MHYHQLYDFHKVYYHIFIFPIFSREQYRKAAYAEPFKSSMAATIPTVEKTRIL
jgi:hypothetical protein